MQPPGASGLSMFYCYWQFDIVGNNECKRIIWFGHGQFYIKTLEIERTMWNTITASVRVVPSNISIENFNLNEETSSGEGTNHSINSIVVQEVTRVDQTREVWPAPTTERKMLIYSYVTELRPCFAKPKAETNFVVSKSEPVCDLSSIHSQFWTV